MKHNFILPLLIVLGIFLCKGLNGQKINHLSVALTTETFSFPFTRFLPIHPGLEIGTSVLEKTKRNSQHHINLLVGGYHHRKIENAFYLRGEYVYSYKIQNYIAFDFPLGAGYQHGFYPGEVYAQNKNTGEWDKIKQLGKPHALVNFGLGFTYLPPPRLQPFVRYESVVDFPLYNGFLTTRTFLKIGINIKLAKNENQ